MDLNLEQNTEKPVSKLKTGIIGFDDISQGGLPKGRATLLAGTSGSCKTIMALNFLFNGIVSGERGAVFVTFEETPNDIKRNVHSFGWYFDQFEAENKFAFVDASIEPDVIIDESGEYDLSALIARIEYAVDKTNADRVAIDSISTIFSQFQDAGFVRRELFRIAASLKMMGVTTLITAERLDEYGGIARFGVEEFVADNVIIARNNLEQEKRRRTLEILKFRGAAHQKGEYPFTISEKGIEVIPLSSMRLTMESSEVRMSTGNKELDRMCGGGYFRDSIILVSGATGTGKTLLGTTFMNDGCVNDEKVLMFAFEESRAQLLRNATGWNMDFRRWEDEGLLKVICNYPESVGIADHLRVMKDEIDNFKPDRIVLDSLSAIERVATVKSFREFVIGLTSFIKDRQIAGMFTATTPTLMGGNSITEQHISTITDSIVLLRYVEVIGEVRRGLTVLKMRGSQHDKSIRECNIDENGIHIGSPFHNVGGILSGSDVQIVVDEKSNLSSMFNSSL